MKLTRNCDEDLQQQEVVSLLRKFAISSIYTSDSWKRT